MAKMDRRRHWGPFRASGDGFGFIVGLALLDNLAWGVAAPVLPGLLTRLAHDNLSDGARNLGLAVAIFALMNLFASPVLGAVSDRFGRRPVLIASMVGMGLDFCLMGLAPTVVWLFVGRALGGVTAASYATANAYVADITEPERRSARFGVLNAAFGLGLLLGPLLGGVLGQLDLRAPFWLGAGLCGANALYGAFVLPESLSPSHRAPLKLRAINPLSALAIFRGKSGLLYLAAGTFAFVLSQQVLFSAMIPYLSARYHFSTLLVGVTVMVMGLGIIVSQVLLLKPVVSRFGERAAMMFGLAGGVVSMALFGLAPNGALFLCVVPIQVIANLFSPASQALMSAEVGADAQGRLQGARSAAEFPRLNPWACDLHRAISDGARARPCPLAYGCALLSGCRLDGSRDGGCVPWLRLKVAGAPGSVVLTQR